MHKLTVSLAIFMLCVALSAAAAQQLAPVPIQNGAFDQGTQASGLPKGWQPYAGSAQATTTVAPGGKAIIIDDNDVNAETGVVQTFAVKPKLGYEVSAQVRAFMDRPNTGAFMQLRFLPSGELVQTNLTAQTTTDFEEVTLRGYAPAGTTSAMLYLYSHKETTPKVMVTNVKVVSGVAPPPPPPPPPVPPVYDKLKDMHLTIPLVEGGNAACSIVAPKTYAEAAAILQAALEKRSGVKVPIIADADPGAVTPFVGNLIVLGNRSTCKTSNELYDRYYSLMDLKYPGPKGYAVRSLHNPYGNGFSAVLVGGSDTVGVTAGAQAFADSLSASGAAKGKLSVGWTMLTKLGEGFYKKVPTDIKEFETWEASKGYGSVGYFGWCSISKRMAMYYMTGDPFQAREVIRLSFPDAQAIKEIEDIDGERIENKHDPLAGPYRYNAMMLILYWNLIEASPAFTDADRLKVTNAFARRLNHEQDKSTYTINDTPSGVSSRHGQWSALSLYTLGRYFNKYYPSPLWAHAQRAGELAFSSLHGHAWLSGESDNLFWYCTGIAPTLTYLVLSGDRRPIENGVLTQLLHGQEVLISGRVPDWALNFAALDFFNKAAYLTHDGRWLTYRQRTQMDTDIFRLGQSFWPDDSLPQAMPTDLMGKWLENPMPRPMWASRGVSWPATESFQWMSYRSAPDAGGDYILIDGYNGASRNPYHTYDLLELRLNGRTLLQGYMNQVLTSADGMVEPLVPMDGQLLYKGVLGPTAIAVGQVPNMPYANWRRTIAQRTGKYSLIVDDLTFKADSQNMKVNTTWQFTSGVWNLKDQAIRAGAPGGSFFELRSSDVQETRGGSIANMNWTGAVKAGERRKVFYLIAQNNDTAPQPLACVQLDRGAAVLALPNPALAVAGDYQDTRGDLVVMATDHLFGHNVTHASLHKSLLLTADKPVDVDWDFAAGTMGLSAAEATTVSVAAAGEAVQLDGKAAKLTKAGDLYALDLPQGRHTLTGLKPADTGAAHAANLAAVLADGKARRVQIMSANARSTPTTYPDFPAAMTANIGAKVTQIESLTGTDGPQIAVAGGKVIHIMTPDGKVVRRLETDGKILSLRWWEKYKLLLAGCQDEKLIAFDEAGQRKWVFTSVMDPAVYEAAKTYWFKFAPGHEGVRGLFTGTFLDGKEQAFLGGACTLEIVDEKGQLVKRTPFFWGPGTLFQLLPKPDGSTDLLVSREPGDGAYLWVYNSKTLAKRQGFYTVPSGHTYVPGWMDMGRDHIYLADLYGDGKKQVVSEINGAWNRITVWNLDGDALYNAQFGPGASTPARNMRGVDLVDLDGDGKLEIVTATWAGLVVALDGKCRKLWSAKLISAATVLKALPAANGKPPLIVLGCEDGSVLTMDATGKVTRQGKVDGTPTKIDLIQTAAGPEVILGTTTGQVAGFTP